MTDRVSNCSNTKCSNEECKKDIDETLKNICDILLQSGKSNTEDEDNDSKVNGSADERKPRERKRNKRKPKVVKGWNQLVKPSRDTASLWYTIWKDLGKPRQGDVFNIMKKTRNAYHLTVRRVKNLGSYVENCRILEGTATNEDLFENIRKSRKEKSDGNDNVEGKTEKKAAEVFAKKYKELLTQ